VTGKLDVREAAARLPDEAAPDTSTELAGEMLDDADNLDEVEELRRFEPCPTRQLHFDPPSGAKKFSVFWP
jgi:hypothetical protein